MIAIVIGRAAMLLLHNLIASRSLFQSSSAFIRISLFPSATFFSFTFTFPFSVRAFVVHAFRFPIILISFFPYPFSSRTFFF